MAERRFRVEQTDEGIVLVDREDAEHTVEVRRALVHLTIEARLLRVCRSLVPGGLEVWVTLEITELSLGSKGDFSGLSYLLSDYYAENKIFGIDDTDLEHLEVTHALVVDLEARDRFGYPYMTDSVESAQDDQDDDGDYEEHEEDEEDENHSPIVELWYHTGEDDAGYRLWSALVLTVGLPEPQFSELIEACVAGRADTIVLECGCYANTTGWAFQTARDLILSPGESVRLPIDEATISGPVLTDAPASRASESGENGGHEAGDNEWDRERNESAPRATAGAGPALLIATTVVSVLAALFGAGAVLVLTIAVLGGTAALIATLTSIGIALTERSPLLSEVKLRRGRRSRM